MKKIIVLCISVVSAISMWGCTNQTTPTYTSTQLDSFATCLTQKGIKMYGTDRCPHCQKTKALFGDAFKKITFINCDPKNTRQVEDINIQCITAGIEGYPTWIYNGHKYPGERTLEEIGQIAGCSLTGSQTTQTVMVGSTGAEIVLSGGK